MFKKIMIAITMAVILAVLIAGLYFYSKTSPVGAGEDKILTIKKGETLAGTALNLQNEKLIKSAFYFKLLARIKGVENKIKFGEYKISPKDASSEILNQLVEGKVYLHLVVVPEGFTIKKIAQRLNDEKIVSSDEFLQAALNNTTVDIDGYKPPTLEGYLFPDSYAFAKDSAASEVADVFVNKFKEKVLPLYKEAAAKDDKIMPFPDIVKLASIVEAEAKVAAERPVIASVYYNRLKNKIFLQCDATIQYVLPERKVNIDYNDLAVDSPYNSYLYPGLPPTPIGNPGIAAVTACLYPAKTDYLYFVRNDKAGDGSHVFSKTYAEHLKAIEKFQKY